MIKIDNQTVSVEKITPAIPQKIENVEYTYKFLLEQKENIQKDYDRDLAKLNERQKELDEINLLIKDAQALGVRL